jgi:hypothetical protein
LNWDLTATFGGSYYDMSLDGIEFYAADQTGTTSDPKLVVTYTPAIAAIPVFMNQYRQRAR